MRQRLLARLIVFALATAGLFTAAGRPLAQAPERARPPVPGPPPPLRLPPVHRAALPNGLAIWLVERHEVPVVEVDLVVLTGSAADPPGRFGLASMTAAMLDEGAGARDALAIADEIDLLGADLTTSSSFDWSAVRLHVPVARLAQALAIMADVALRPTFPPHELDRLRQERLTRLVQARDDPAQVASFAFARLLYGPTHRYGTPDLGTAPALRDLTAAELAAFHATHYRPDRAALVIVGDVTLPGIRPLIEAAFGAWRPGPSAAERVAPPPAPPPARRTVYLVDKPGAAQSQIRIGAVGVPRTTPDYFALQVMNTILGGAFTSRLNQNLREQHGYAYGAGSFFDMRLGAGPFVAAAAVQTDKTAEALVEFFKELDGIRRPVPEDELARAKNYLALRFPRQFETTRDIARQVSELIVYGLPEEYFATYIQRIQAVSAADVRRVAERYIQPDSMMVTVVGDRQAIEGRVAALQLGPVRVVPLDEVIPR